MWGLAFGGDFGGDFWGGDFCGGFGGGGGCRSGLLERGELILVGGVLSVCRGVAWLEANTWADSGVCVCVCEAGQYLTVPASRHGLLVGVEPGSLWS